MSLASFLPRGVSDHNPAAVSTGLTYASTRNPFQFFNHLIDHKDFMPTVASIWSTYFEGDAWFVLTSKLKRLKQALKTLNRNCGNLHTRVIDSRKALSNFQDALPSLPSSELLIEERRLMDDYYDALSTIERFLKQKSRVQWLKYGDGNNKIFFNACRGRWNSNKILSLENAEGEVLLTHNDLASEAVSYFQNLLGQSSLVHQFPDDLQLPILASSEVDLLEKPFNSEDIFNALKSLAKNRSPGPDGFTADFFIAT